MYFEKMKRENHVVFTADGSVTLFNANVGDHYHSLHGAETESEYVFISQGFKYSIEKLDEIRILEVGLGTGLNAVLTLNAKQNIKVHYTSLEPFPIEMEIVKYLKFKALDNSVNADFLDLIHSGLWNKIYPIGSDFYFEKVNQTLLDFSPGFAFNLIYYDAFGPAYQPEMWNEQAVDKIYSLMADDAVLVTYCAQGQFRRNLQNRGLRVEKLPGPPGKREMIRVTKC